MRRVVKIIFILCSFAMVISISARYEPTWESLDARPLPAWYDDAKVGIFVHWSVFSVPSIEGGWFWHRWRTEKLPRVVDFMERNYRPGFSYQEFAVQLTAQLWDPNQWAELFQRAGARYVVLTAKHHNGYCLWPSKYCWNWNSMDLGARRDLVGDLASAIRNRTDIHFGLYHSLYEWYNPLYLADREFNTSNFVTRKVLPEMRELVNWYKPEVLWSDGDWDDTVEYWQSREFLAWLYNDSPVRDVVVTNDRWGKGTACKHGGFLNCNDRYDPGRLQNRKWENAFTIDLGAWSYDRLHGIVNYITPEELIATLVRTVSCGGNALINVGPTKDGIIAPIFQERLTQLGDWLRVNGEAIYESRPWRVQNDTLAKDVWYTQRSGTLYAHVLKWPQNGHLRLGSVTSLIGCRMLGYGALQALGSVIKFPALQHVKVQWGWVLDLGATSDHQPQHDFTMEING